MDSLLDTLSSLVTPSFVSQLASSVGESETAAGNALKAAVPAVLGGMLHRTSDGGVMQMLEGLIKDKANDGSLLTNLGGLLGGGASSSPIGALGGKLLSTIFGSQMGALTGALSQLGGVKPASATSILNLAAPIIMSVIGSKLRSSGGGLASLLNGQRQSILDAVPSGLSSLLGALPAVSAPSLPKVPVPPPVPEKSGMGILIPLALLALVGFLIYTMFGRGETHEPAPTVATAPAPAPAATASIWPDLGAFARRMLPGGLGELNIPERGIESRLLAFIENPAAAVDTTTWFDFDRILFDTGAATLRTESDEQITNISSILKAFPNVSLKVGGYTDNTGDAAANMRLSQARAEAVMQAIVAKGVEAPRLEAEGYGDAHPVADNTTEEGRQKNRRVSVRVTKK